MVATKPSAKASYENASRIPPARPRHVSHTQGTPDLSSKTHIGSVRSQFTVTAMQLLRYAVVGVSVNVAGYLLYLWLAYRGLDPKIAATISFAFGVLTGFIFHRRITFRHTHSRWRTMPRYLIAYGAGYVANIAGLYLMVDILGYPHELVQAAMIFIVAAGLFIAQKFWIFRVEAVPH